MTEVNALLLLPANEDGLLTTVDGVESVPWEADDPNGFTVHELGQRMRRKQPIVQWLKDRGLEIEVEQKNGQGVWFRLTSLPERTETPAPPPEPKEDSTWWRR